MASLEDMFRRMVEEHSCVNCEPVNIGKLTDDEILLFEQVKGVECEIKRDIRHLKSKAMKHDHVAMELYNKIHERMLLPDDVLPGIHKKTYEIAISRKEAEQNGIDFTPFD